MNDVCPAKRKNSTTLLSHKKRKTIHLVEDEEDIRPPLIHLPSVSSSFSSSSSSSFSSSAAPPTSSTLPQNQSNVSTVPLTSMGSMLLEQKMKEIKRWQTKYNLLFAKSKNMDDERLQWKKQLNELGTQNLCLTVQVEQLAVELSVMRKQLQKAKEDVKRQSSLVNYTCVICMHNDFDTTLPACGHVFCKSCIDEWKKTNKKQYHGQVQCPLCRTLSNSFIRLIHR